MAEATRTAKAGRNWWKIAFFVLLVAFEITREIAVVSGKPQARPNSNAMVSAYSDLGYVGAEGTWKRIDGGGKLVPGTTKIECWRERGQCIEAHTMIYENSVFAPDLSYFPAKFSSDAVSYENDAPACARYSVRIDLNLKKAFAIRDRKENPANENCAKLERRIEMQLADGYEYDDKMGDSFLPIFSLFKLAFG